MNNIPQDLEAIFHAAIRAVAGKDAVKKELKSFSYPKLFYVIAIGKAADSMIQGIPDERIITGLVISKHGHISKDIQENPKLICLESDHPIPKNSSLKAGDTLLNYLKKLQEKEPILFLISGGASALVEVLQTAWNLEQLQTLTDYLLANAYSIDEINAVRRRISIIKGGGLWSFIHERAVSCLMISDVPNDDPAIIGSGLLFPCETDASFSLPKLPQKWQGKLSEYSPQRVADDFNWKIIACLDDAKKAAAAEADRLGFDVKIMPEFLKGDAEAAAISCVETLKKHKNILHIWGGETTVKLPKNAGKGGRNQHLALAAAIEMQGLEGAFLLAAGTDGSDGTSTATGALVDNKTLHHGEQKGLRADDFLNRADSNSFFQQLDGIITTGATGTNVMDVVIGIAF